MSVKQMSIVWELDLEPNERLVLLAYADHADDDGDRVYPSLGRVAHKTGYSVQQVRRLSRQLVEAGLMELVEKGRGRGHTHRYRLTLEKGIKLQPFKPKAEKVSNGTEKVTSEQEKVSPMVPEPSEETSVSTDSEKQAPPASQHTESQKLTNDFYNRLKGRYNITLEKEQYEFHLGHFRNMLTKYEPTEEEQLRVIAYMVDKYPAMPKIRATKAIQDVRLGRDTGEAWSGPAPWEVVPEQDKNSAYAHLEDYTTTTAEERRKIARQILTEA